VIVAAILGVMLLVRPRHWVDRALRQTGQRGDAAATAWMIVTIALGACLIGFAVWVMFTSL